MTSDSAKWCPVHNTTPTINGLRLVRPEEAGKYDRDLSGNTVYGILFREKTYLGHIGPLDYMSRDYSRLVDLPKPRTTRPYRRGEVRLGDMFRNKEDGYDKIVSCVTNRGVDLGWLFCSYTDLLGFYNRLTYDSEGREVLSEAGIEE